MGSRGASAPAGPLREIGALAVVVLLLVAGCSSVSICLEQDKGVSASDDVRAATQACAPNPRPPR